MSSALFVEQTSDALLGEQLQHDRMTSVAPPQRYSTILESYPPEPSRNNAATSHSDLAAIMGTLSHIPLTTSEQQQLITSLNALDNVSPRSPPDVHTSTPVARHSTDEIQGNGPDIWTILGSFAKLSPSDRHALVSFLNTPLLLDQSRSVSLERRDTTSSTLPSYHA